MEQVCEENTFYPEALKRSTCGEREVLFKSQMVKERKTVQSSLMKVPVVCCLVGPFKVCQVVSGKGR